MTLLPRSYLLNPYLCRSANICKIYKKNFYQISLPSIFFIYLKKKRLPIIVPDDWDSIFTSACHVFTSFNVSPKSHCGAVIAKFCRTEFTGLWIRRERLFEESIANRLEKWQRFFQAIQLVALQRHLEPLMASVETSRQTSRSWTEGAA